MFEEPKDQDKNEKLFQKMFVNNLEATAKIFFRGLNITRVKKHRDQSKP
jgi:hypothetical protein